MTPILWSFWKWSEKWKGKWCDIWPSMVTHTLNLCSAFNSSKCKHTHHEHTPRAVGNHLCCSTRGFGALLKGTSVVVLRVEEGTFTPLIFNSCRSWDSDSQPLGYESDSLTIRPRLPLFCVHFEALDISADYRKVKDVIILENIQTHTDPKHTLEIPSMPQFYS